MSKICGQLSTVFLLLLLSVSQVSAEYQWTQLPDMNFFRIGGEATLLKDGRVLIVGGQTQHDMYSDQYTVAETEIFDPSTLTFSLSGSLNIKRCSAGLTVLNDGKVLVIGGSGGSLSPALNSVEIYDPSSGIFSLVGNMGTNRIYTPNGTLLSNGDVLILGGTYEGIYANVTSSIDRYEYSTGGILGNIGGLLNPRSSKTPKIRLQNGEILIVGGAKYGPPVAELYNPATNTSSLPNSEPAGGNGSYSMVYLPNGKVLIKNSIVTYPEYYNPETRNFEVLYGCGEFAINPYREGMLLLNNGKVLFVGAQISLFNPETEQIEETIDWPQEGVTLPGIVLSDDSVLFFSRVSDYNSYLLTFVSPNIPPTNLSLSYDNDNNWNLITWDDNSAASYNLYWGTEPGVTKSSELAGNTSNTEFSHTGVVHGWTYYYRVAAVDALGNESELSNEISVYVPENPNYTIFFEDFEDGDVDEPWKVEGTYEISNGLLHMQGGNNTWVMLTQDGEFINRFEADILVSSSSDQIVGISIQWGSYQFALKYVSWQGFRAYGPGWPSGQDIGQPGSFDQWYHLSMTIHHDYVTFAVNGVETDLYHETFVFPDSVTFCDGYVHGHNALSEINYYADNIKAYVVPLISSDSDLDGIMDDGDNSGIAGDNYCSGGQTTNCDDNCKDIPNIDQADLDNDGEGNLCDDDVDGDGLTNDLDPDDDNDGMPDDWENQYEGLDPYYNDADEDLDEDGATNIIEFNSGTIPDDPESYPIPYPCLDILSIVVEDSETAEIPVSGKDSKLKVTIRNSGQLPTENRWVDVGAFSIDVQGENCDLWGDDWQDGEKLIQVQTFKSINIPVLNPGEQTTLTFETIFVNGCFSDKLLVLITPEDTTPFCSTNVSLQKEIHPFYLSPNPDAFTSCVWTISTSLISPFLKINKTDISALTELIKLGTLDYSKYRDSILLGDFQEIGKATFICVWDVGKMVFKLSGDAIVAKFMTVFKAMWDELHNQGCGEAFPYWWSFLTDFLKGICDKISDVGEDAWSFIFGSPADLEIIDSSGNSIYVSMSGVLTNTIPDAIGYTLDNGTVNPIKAVLILGNGPFDVNIYGTDDGFGSFSMIQPRSDNDIAIIKHDLIPLGVNTEVYLTLGSETVVYPLEIDLDGDGGTDQTKNADSIEVLKPADINGDGHVDVEDLSAFALHFGRCNCDDGQLCEGDTDYDQVVDGSDLVKLIQAIESP